MLIGILVFVIGLIASSIPFRGILVDDDNIDILQAIPKPTRAKGINRNEQQSLTEQQSGSRNSSKPTRDNSSVDEPSSERTREYSTVQGRGSAGSKSPKDFVR